MTEITDYVNKRNTQRILKPYSELFLDDATDVELETMRLLWMRFETLPTREAKQRVMDWLVNRFDEAGANA